MKASTARPSITGASFGRRFGDVDIDSELADRLIAANNKFILFP